MLLPLRISPSTLESEVGLSGVHVRLVYLNGDGSEIYTHDFE